MQGLSTILNSELLIVTSMLSCEDAFPSISRGVQLCRYALGGIVTGRTARQRENTINTNITTTTTTTTKTI